MVGLDGGADEEAGEGDDGEAETAGEVWVGEGLEVGELEGWCERWRV